MTLVITYLPYCLPRQRFIQAAKEGRTKMSPTIFEDKAPNVAAAIIILVAISAVVFPLRIYTRVKHKAFGWDDFTMCCAAVSSTSS